jgi:lipopolysaccharide transport system ATP-binding protein
MSREVAIRVEGLGKCYDMYHQPTDRLKQAIVPRLARLVGRTPRRYARQFWALSDVTFDVERGETVGVIGRNGSGKSTLLQIICGTLSPATGTVEVRGRVAALLELGSGFAPEFTGRDNVYMNAAVLGLTPAEIDERYAAIAAFADIGDFIDQPVKTYSSGMAVRLAFAVSVSVAPDILIIDEALAVGDMAFQQKCLQRLTDLREAGTTILLVTHDIMLTRNYCSRVVYLDRGRVQAIGDAETVGEQYRKDVLSVQQAGGSASAVEWKSGGGRLRFGTDSGSITGSAISGGRHAGALFDQGERATVRIEARVAAEVRHPELLVQFRDTRGYVLYGVATNPTDLLVATSEGWRVVTAALDVPLAFGPGDYSVTLAVVDRQSESVATVLDKIVAAMQISVLPMPGSRAHGPVHLAARWLDPSTLGG